MAPMLRPVSVFCAFALVALSASAEGAPSFWRYSRFPAVTSPDTTCVAIGEPFAFQVTYRSKKPWALKMIGFAGRPVPKGFAFDPKTGVLTGRMDAAGDRMVTFIVVNEAGCIVTWGDLKVRARPSRRQPKTLAGETFYQLQIPGFTESGDLAGVRRHLKRLADLGIAWVYLSPITVADRGEDPTYWSRRQRLHGNPRNPYRPADYYNVEPEYGTNASFRELVEEAHRLGLKVMTDVVFYHCGPNAVFLKEHPDWVCRDKDGKPVRNEWMFPKLDIANRELRKYLKDSLIMWALDYGVDGFRTDCGCDTPLDFWEDCAAAIDAKKKDFVWLLEGGKPEYGEKAYNIFYGFRCGHGGVNTAMDEKYPASIVREKWLEERLSGPAHAYFMRGTDTHDIANDDGEHRQERRWGHRRAETALALSFALDGPMMLWQGQEIGWDKPYCIFTHTYPDWENPPAPERAAVIRRLATLKRTEPAFGAEGKIVWLEPENPDDQVVFLRVAPDGKAYRCFFDLCAGTWDIRAETTGAAHGCLRIARGEFDRYWAAIASNPAPVIELRVDAGLGPHDAYRVIETNGVLSVTGSNERSCLYAVYDFFERKGCAWFWDGDRLPEKSEVKVEGADFSSQARFDYRGLRYFAHRSLTRFQAEQWTLDDWKREIDWCCKRRLNLLMPRIGQDDLFSRAFPDVVPYPKGYEGVSATPRSYDDRTLFWDMKTRSEIRRGIVDYARERGLDVPVDTGTMSHWYSRTPQSFLDKMKPDFIPQANGSYNERSGLVWDIRQEKWLDAYWKLTQAEVDTYFGGMPRVFHTIGLGERVCYKDRAQNHAFKLYANRRIIDKLREHYPQAPLLIGSWDFISSWSPAEVRSFVRTLDPKNTVILDYTSDIWDNDDNFQNWDLAGKFPWIYGIFHAYEASNEIRGNYANIRQRFPKAAEDPMCKGVVFWPEMSHGDPLMIDYFPSIGWDPSVYEINDYLPGFCRRRYGAADAERRLGLWRRFLPLAEASRWGTQVGNGYKYSPVREFYPDTYFNLHGWFYGDDAKYAAQHAEYYVFEEKTLGPLVTNAVDTLNALAREDFTKLDAMTRRDFIDIARTTLARMIELQMARIGRVYGEYVFGGEADAVRRELAKTRALGRALTKVLESSDEFSLNASLAEMRRHPTNPDFEKTLKGNAANVYCRSFIYELSKEVYEPAFAAFSRWAEERLARGDRSRLNGTAAEQEKLFAAVREAFFAKPLAEMSPNSLNAIAELPGMLGGAAKTAAGDAAAIRRLAKLNHTEKEEPR